MKHGISIIGTAFVGGFDDLGFFFLFFCAGRRFNQAHWEHFVCWSHSILAAFLTPTSPAGYLSLKRAMGSATLDRPAASLEISVGS